MTTDPDATAAPADNPEADASPNPGPAAEPGAAEPAAAPEASEDAAPAASTPPPEGGAQLMDAPPVRPLDGPEYVEVDGEMIPNYDMTLPEFGEGDVVTGRVVRIDKDEVLVDIGYKSEGVIPLSELSIRKSVNVFDEVNLGDEVDALVMKKEDDEGRLILSKKRARFERAWQRIEKAANESRTSRATSSRW